MKIRLTALDTLFFRDGKPFNRGEETWADGIFPPPPSVLYGALRSLYFIKHPQQIAKAGIENDPTTKLSINNIQLCKINELGEKETLIYPWPSDVLRKKEKEIPVSLALQKSKATLSSSVFKSYSLQPNGKVKTSDEAAFLQSANAFEEKYLNGKTLEKQDVILQKKLLTTEPKVGISRDNFTHVADEGLLYRVGMQRPENEAKTRIDIEATFDLEGFDLKIGEKGFLKLGGEGKTVAYEVLEETPKNNFIIKSEIFKMYFATPALFKKGWKPNFIGDDLKGTWKGIELELIAATVDKPMHIGGWDMKKGEPKTMYKAVAEGSVFYFKILEESTAKLPLPIKQPFSLSDFRQKEGFGLAYCANTDFETTNS